jgi:GNAT superfamily N-acetyltransferase
MTATITLDLNGMTDLPVEKVAFVVTSLEMVEAPDWNVDDRPGLVIERWQEADPARFRDLYRAVGSIWLWFSRLMMTDAELREILHKPTTELYILRQNGKEAGILELDFSAPEDVEIVFFGLVPDAVGVGVGRWLMGQALEIAWSRPTTKRVWLHTCTGDSPQALSFYRNCGFIPYKRSIEVVDDPRKLGVFDPHLGAHVPCLV